MQSLIVMILMFAKTMAWRLQLSPLVKNVASEVPIQTSVFGDAAASRERMLDHLSGKEKEDECPPSLIKNLLLAYAVLAAASL